MSTEAEATSVKPKRQRKPPRITPAILRQAAKLGYEVAIDQKPDGTLAWKLTKPGATDPNPETPEGLRKLL
jgi:hypothetical protein